MSSPSRIAALGLIAATVLLLGYLRLTSGDDVDVPHGARAGQLADLHACEFDQHKADCGTLVVPENRHASRSRLIALPVIRIRAAAKHPAEPIFRLEGGPGITNLKFDAAKRFTANHDVVLVGYRGVDGSARLDCPEVTDARRTASDLLAPEALRASARGFNDCAQRLTDDGYDLAGYTLAQRTDDFEDARRALGYDRINLLSESAGTRTAQIYAYRHPASLNRSVQVAVNPPGRYVWSQADTDAQLRRYAALCRCDPSLGRNVPDRWGPLKIKPGNVEAAAFFGLMEAGPDASLSAPMVIDAYRSGDARGFWTMSLLAGVIFPHAQIWGDAAAVARVDAASARRQFAQGTQAPASAFLWAGGHLADRFAPTPDDTAYAAVRDTNVETLLISGELDGATPPQHATNELLPHLERGHQVILRGFGHTTDFWTLQTGAADHLITTYLDTGRVDNRYRPQRVDFTPQTRFTDVGQRLAMLLCALAGFTLLALLTLVIRRPGRRTGVVVRVLLLPILGLGGLALGALLVLIAFPTVPLDAITLAVPSIGLPVALGAHLASDRAGRAGLAGAAAGAMLGAWLGFGCAAAPMALLTAVIGAVAGANLMLLVTDYASRRTVTTETRSSATRAMTARSSR